MTLARESTLLFTGHRQIPKADIPVLEGRLKKTVELFASRGYVSFLCGGAVGFDTLAAEAVLRERCRRPEIQLILALPCRDQTMKWENLEHIKKYKEILGSADFVHYSSDFYSPGCMHERNRFMVDNSSVCVAYMKHARGGTSYTCSYARRRGLTLINLASSYEQLSFI